MTTCPVAKLGSFRAGVSRASHGATRRNMAPHCATRRDIAPHIRPVGFDLTDAFFCVNLAPDEAAVRKHAEEGGFPANKILRVRRIIDPLTSE